jgi:hypothetical protein
VSTVRSRALSSGWIHDDKGDQSLVPFDSSEVTSPLNVAAPHAAEAQGATAGQVASHGGGHVSQSAPATRSGPRSSSVSGDRVMPTLAITTHNGSPPGRVQLAAWEADGVAWIRLSAASTDAVRALTRAYVRGVLFAVVAVAAAVSVSVFTCCRVAVSFVIVDVGAAGAVPA